MANPRFITKSQIPGMIESANVRSWLGAIKLTDLKVCYEREEEVGAKKMTTDAVSIQLTGGHTVTALALLPALNRLSTMLSAVIASPIWSLSLSSTSTANNIFSCPGSRI
ncbi:hypothetical protein POV97_10425 [Enterobacter cloacae]